MNIYIYIYIYIYVWEYISYVQISVETAGQFVTGDLHELFPKVFFPNSVYLEGFLRNVFLREGELGRPGSFPSCAWSLPPKSFPRAPPRGFHQKPAKYTKPEKKCYEKQYICSAPQKKVMRGANNYNWSFFLPQRALRLILAIFLFFWDKKKTGSIWAHGPMGPFSG